jgi:hypothetical protein
MEPGVFQEIGADPTATVQAIIVVVVASLVGGLGTIFSGDFDAVGWILGGAYSIVGLAITAGVIYLISRLFQARGDYTSLFRSLGYASAPQALAIIPILGWLAGLVWSLILAIRAVKETQAVSGGAAAAIVLIPAAIVFVIVVILVVALGVALVGLGVAASTEG